MENLIDSLDKLHTTKMGEDRIRKNLSLSSHCDVVDFCKNAIKNADLAIFKDKNWYVYGGGNAITVNARSQTIITAHKIKARIHTMKDSEFPCLNEFLYQAIFIPKGAEPPPREIILEKEIYIYIENFGSKIGDLGVVAEVNGQVIGAAWTRIIAAFGHLDDNTPELAISLLPEFRGLGIGTMLMKKLFALLQQNGYKRTSLSVQKDNPAVEFYKKLGYRITGDVLDHIGQQDYIMVKEFGKL